MTSRNYGCPYRVTLKFLPTIGSHYVFTDFIDVRSPLGYALLGKVSEILIETNPNLWRGIEF